MADQAVTLATATSATNGKLLIKLSQEESVNTGFTHKWRIPFDVINTSTWTTQGDTVTVTLGTTPTRYIVDRALISVTTAFATTGTLTVSLGTSSNTALCIAATTAKTDSQITGAAGAVVANKTEGVAAATLQARFTTQAATGAPSDITAGSCDIWLRMIDTARA